MTSATYGAAPKTNDSVMVNKPSKVMIIPYMFLFVAFSYSTSAVNSVYKLFHRLPL